MDWVNISPVVIERIAGEYLQRVVVGSRNSRVVIDPAVEGEDNRVTVEGELFFRYSNSTYPPSELNPGKRDRRMFFELYATVINIDQHRPALDLANYGLGILTDWIPTTTDNKCLPGIIEGLAPESDGFVNMRDGFYRYRAQLSLLATHARIQTPGLYPWDHPGFKPGDQSPWGTPPIVPPPEGFHVDVALFKSRFGHVGELSESVKFKDLVIKAERPE